MTSRALIAALLMCFLMVGNAHGETQPCDTTVTGHITEGSTMATTTDSVDAEKPEEHNTWIEQLIDNGFRIHDPKIRYPKFPAFCLKVYDWGNRMFNTYDPQYVVGVGKNWKAMVKNYNWMTSYMMFFQKDHTLHMRSEIFNDIGAYVSFMAVGIGYTAKVDNLIGHGKKTRENFNTSFTSSRFSASFNYWKTIGDMKITHFGHYNQGHHFAYSFDAVRLRSYSAEAYYFFNNKKYSQAAAYCYSKYQLKSAGSWMVGLAFNHQTLDMDFTALPQDMKDYLQSLDDIYRVRFNDYDVMAGYGHNWVPVPRRWVINLTVLPSVGYRYSYEDSSDGKRDMFSANLRALFSTVYNHRALFASVQARFDGHLYFNDKYTMFDSIESLSLNVGFRF